MAAALWEKTTDPLDRFLSRVIAFSDSNHEFDDDDKVDHVNVLCEHCRFHSVLFLFLCF